MRSELGYFAHSHILGFNDGAATLNSFRFDKHHTNCVVTKMFCTVPGWMSRVQHHYPGGTVWSLQRSGSLPAPSSLQDFCWIPVWIHLQLSLYSMNFNIKHHHGYGSQLTMAHDLGGGGGGTQCNCPYRDVPLTRVTFSHFSNQLPLILFLFSWFRYGGPICI